MRSNATIRRRTGTKLFPVSSKTKSRYDDIRKYIAGHKSKRKANDDAEKNR